MNKKYIKPKVYVVPLEGEINQVASTVPGIREDFGEGWEINPDDPGLYVG